MKSRLVRRLVMAAVIGSGGLLCGVDAALAAENCTRGERALAQARDRIAERDREEAMDLLRQSIKACPSHAGYQLLGEQAAQSKEQADKEAAVDAFVSASELAATNRERATTLRAYAELLQRENDPQNAFTLITLARQLQPDDAQIAQLAQQLTERYNNPQPGDFRSGLRSRLYKEIRVVSTAVPGAAKAASLPAAAPSGGSTPASGRTVNIPINFETNSTVVDDLTRRNLQVLAQDLASPEFADKRFLFVGHADVRGGENHNVLLSRQRAEAVYEEVARLVPSLRDRVRVEGRGSSMPLDTGNSEEAHRRNRRLEVIAQ